MELFIPVNWFQITHRTPVLNLIIVLLVDFLAKNLGTVLDSNLNFKTQIDEKIKKCNKMIDHITRLSINLPHNGLLTICKSFIKPHLNYSNTLYDKPDNENFQNKIGKVQYKACLAITGGIQGTSRERLYDEWFTFIN